MNSEQEVADDELDNNELLCDVVHQDSDLTRLSEMVRKHYLNYLEKQLRENLTISGLKDKKNGVNKENYEESIKKTAELLEDKAVKACMIAQFYQRAMVKIISLVRRSTQEKRIITQLEKLILTQEETKLKTLTKETQTEAGLLVSIENDINNIPSPPPIHVNYNDADADKPTMSLDEKIQMFQKHLQKEKCAEVMKKCPLNRIDQYSTSKRNHKHTKRKSHHRHHRPYKEQSFKNKPEEEQFSPTISIITKTSSPAQVPTATVRQQSLSQALNNDLIFKEQDNDDNDSVAMELARLFSEEKTELDEIFGIDPNEEPDDPQICKILKEIEESKINYEYPETSLEDNNTVMTLDAIKETPVESLNISIEPISIKQKPNSANNASKKIDLSKSIWPCELFMQRRKLSESLARLIEEDLRWHDVIKWKFSQLFGEDSDDEFTPCSPSIELNETLIGSCIKRISPWVVKHLMKPMKDGLIGNRFLFKKLAKHLARCIIMENQYPDEYLIKNCIENFFCLHQVVTSLDDIVEMPNISLL